jgi:hypothetical protein
MAVWRRCRAYAKVVLLLSNEDQERRHRIPNEFGLRRVGGYEDNIANKNVSRTQSCHPV